MVRAGRVWPYPIEKTGSMFARLGCEAAAPFSALSLFAMAHNASCGSACPWRFHMNPGHLHHPLFVSNPTTPSSPPTKRIPMSTSTASSSFSSGSSLSSSQSPWSHSLSHPPPPCIMNTTATTSASRTNGALPATPSIAAFPSLTHSLSAFPTMTMVTNDMVHYGTLGRTKGASEAKVRAPPHSSLRVATCFRHSRDSESTPPACRTIVC